MRKIMYILPPVALVLCLVLVLIMTGVWQIPSLSPGPTTSQSTGTGNTTPSTSAPEETAGGEYVRQNMISIALPEMTNTVVSEDGTVLFRHTFQDISLISPNPRVNEIVTLDLLQRMDINASTVVMLEDMTQYYTPGTEWNTLYYEFIYSPTRIDNAILSLKGAESVYTGSGQANNSIICVNYYLPTGQVMTLGETLSEESGSQDALLQALLRVLAHNATQWELFEDYSEPVIRYFSSYLQQENNWFFSPEGLNICFAPYEIAPQTSGTIVATIPYEELTGILRSRENSTQLQGGLSNRTGPIDLDGPICQLRLGLIQDAPQLFVFSSLRQQQLQKVCAAKPSQFPFCHNVCSFPCK